MNSAHRASALEPFFYHDGTLCVEGLKVAALAEHFGTPAFVYSRQGLLDSFNALRDAFAALDPKLCYSIKSCHNLHVLALLREAGAWFDAVSIGEVQRAIDAGADAAHIVFAGVGKTRAEIEAAIELGVGCFDVESPAELEVLATCAEDAQKQVTAALRVNPDVDAKTHRYTTTGTKENKFGIETDQARPLFVEKSQHPFLRLTGMHLHIGSPVNTVEPFVQAIIKALALIDELAGEGCRIDLLNIGGGWGTNYRDGEAPPFTTYAEAIAPLLAGRDLDIHLEPGRSIAANAGVLITRATYLKQGMAERFVIVDAAMTDLIRPALYEAYHFVWPVTPGQDLVPAGKNEEQLLEGLVKVDVVGPVCESSDFLAKDRLLPPIEAGDLLAVFSAGAYGAVMGSQYNSRPRPPEILVEGDQARVIRRRETYDDLVRIERDNGA